MITGSGGSPSSGGGYGSGIRAGSGGVTSPGGGGGSSGSSTISVGCTSSRRWSSRSCVLATTVLHLRLPFRRECIQLFQLLAGSFGA